MRRRHFLGLAGAASLELARRAAVAEPSAATTAPPDSRFYARTRTGSCRLLWSVETSERVVALTFDDGPCPRYTGEILDVLARHRATATFFAIGANVERHPTLAAQVAAGGHEVANHTHSHPRVEHLAFADLQREVEAGAATIEAATGERSRWFRPPRGMVTGAVVAAAAAEGHDVAMWSVTRGGPAVPDDDDAAVLASMLGNLHPGAILVLHDGVGASDLGRPQLLRRRDAELRALDPFLTRATAQGYRFVSLGELVSASSPDDQPVSAVATAQLQ